MSSYVLGTHTSHDGSACLLKDGKVLVAIEKERITREKHAGGPDDSAAVNYCLEAAGIGIEDVELVVQNDNFHNFENPLVPDRLSNARRIETISHHLAHAYSAIGTSPFQESNILVIDGCGSPYTRCGDLGASATIPNLPPEDYGHLVCEKDSFYHYRGGELATLYKDFSVLQDFGQPRIAPQTTMHSIGGGYLGVSTYVFRGLDDPGKLMGLAPYGRDGVITDQLFELRDGRVFVNYEWMKKFDRPARSYEEFKQDFQYYADIAYWAQREIERALIYIIRHRYELKPCPNLSYAGGVALNAVANRRILTDTQYENVYFQPAAADNGLAVGCAYYGWLALLGRERVEHSGNPYFGKAYGRERILEDLNRHKESISYAEHEDVVDVAAAALSAGKVVAWFQGGSEFGPRALGHRSILALPNRAEVRDFINAKIKFREDFRPFAPSVPFEDAPKYFTQDYPSPYMILVANTKPEWRDKIPAVVHADYSARVQTVHPALSPRYYDLHRRVEKFSGESVLLNTSLNRRGMPIVETPEEAITLFLETALDLLIIGNFLVKKNQEKAIKSEMDETTMVNLIMQRLHDPAAAIFSHSVAIQLTELEEELCIDFRNQSLSAEAIPNPDFTLRCPAKLFARLAGGEIALDDAITQGLIETPGLKKQEYDRFVSSMKVLLHR